MSRRSGAAIVPALSTRDHAEQDIRAILNEWTQSLKERDLRRQISFYAPEMDRYFLQRNVSREFVQRDKSKAFEAIKEIRMLNIDDISVEFLSDSKAFAKFTKTWDMTLVSGKTHAGRKIAQLHLSLINGRWEITAERELQVLWVRRQ